MYSLLVHTHFKTMDDRLDVEVVLKLIKLEINVSEYCNGTCCRRAGMFGFGVSTMAGLD
jgi:hypothetical protein